MQGVNLNAFLQGKIIPLDYNSKKYDSCEKMYLYPSSLKKHYSVSHREEYEKYLEDKKSKVISIYSL